MRLIPIAAQWIYGHPIAFLGRTLRSFRASQGLLLAGAVAYYALLSLVPLLILAVIVLSRLIDQSSILATLGRYLEWLVPSQSQAVLSDVAEFIDNQVVIGFVLAITMLFFSSLAFSILGKALAVIFSSRRAAGQRSFLVSALLPYTLVVLLGMTLLCITGLNVVLRAVTQSDVHLLGLDVSLSGITGPLIYAAGFTSEVAILAVLYIVLPPGRTKRLHALMGAFATALVWDCLRHILVWYFTKLSKASIVYGSLTTAVVVLFCMEIIATLFLLGAQLIAEYENLEEELSKPS